MKKANSAWKVKPVPLTREAKILCPEEEVQSFLLETSKCGHWKKTTKAEHTVAIV